MELIFLYFLSPQAHLFSVLGEYNNYAFNTVHNTDIYNTDIIINVIQTCLIVERV